MQHEHAAVRSVGDMNGLCSSTNILDVTLSAKITRAYAGLFPILVLLMEHAAQIGKLQQNGLKLGLEPFS